MDINTLRGLSTLLLLVAFIGLVFWVYSGRRKESYDKAANLPFADEEAHSKTLKEEVGPAKNQHKSEA
ncbi:MAG: cbb3-type cytochrome c oxidase subunit 3 [Halieaceae bacterium]|jgi:cytochrome c oxidase cbb3-type subunit 4|nr:cbb3-type cytochrome c oxidase subunit 3 [Halieaceae bacterium]